MELKNIKGKIKTAFDIKIFYLKFVHLIKIYSENTGNVLWKSIQQKFFNKDIWYEFSSKVSTVFVIFSKSHKMMVIFPFSFHGAMADLQK